MLSARNTVQRYRQFKKDKKMNYVNTNQKKAEVAVLTTDKDFRKRNIISHNYSPPRGTSWHDKGVNSPKRHNNPKCICTLQQNVKIHEAKTEKRNRQIHNYS